MSEGKRPGGLTALAVLNFVFGGFSAIGFLGLAAVMAIVSKAADVASGAAGSDSQAMDEMAKAWQEIGMGLFYFVLVLMGLSAFLLIASGVGYLQQKRVLGRGLGNGYAILSILSSVISGLMVSDKAGGGFNIGTIIGLVYPVLTLALLNGTFKNDFTR